MPEICRNCAGAYATYHIPEPSVGDVKVEIHLCEPCARAAGFIVPFSPALADILTRVGADALDRGHAVFPASPMACRRCSRGHASIHLFESRDGYEREDHLCEECGKAAADALDSVFTDFPDQPSREAEPRTTCPECGRLRFDFEKVGAPIRGRIQFAVLPVRILVRGCAWQTP